MATILSFKEVADILGVRITTVTNKERVMTVTLNGNFSSSRSVNMGSIFMKEKRKNDEAEENNNINNNTIIDYSYLRTIK